MSDFVEKLDDDERRTSSIRTSQGPRNSLIVSEGGLYTLILRSRDAVKIDGEVWFVGLDVARALGYKRTSDALQQHCKGAVKHRPLLSASGVQSFRIISRPDVYRLIVSSTLPDAERFRLWVYREVLP